MHWPILWYIKSQYLKFWWLHMLLSHLKIIKIVNYLVIMSIFLETILFFKICYYVNLIDKFKHK